MQRIGLVINLKKPRATQIAESVISFLEEKGKQVFFDHDAAQALGRKAAVKPGEEFAAYCDCIIVLGGDGTLLNTARTRVGNGVPLLGINLGHLGFLTEVEVEDTTAALEQLIAGNYRIEERMMIKAVVKREDKVLEEFQALNDAIITKGAFSRLIHLDTYIDDKFFATFPADGLIVATPTGCTAYSLSAGGPLLMPDLDTMIVTPICPHTLYSRPLVIHGNSVVRTVVKSKPGEVVLTLDGQDGHYLQYMDEILIKKAECSTKLVKLNTRNFYEILRAKMKEGGSTDV